MVDRACRSPPGKCHCEIAHRQPRQQPPHKILKPRLFTRQEFDRRRVGPPNQLAEINPAAPEQSRQPLPAAKVQFVRPMTPRHHPDISGQDLSPSPRRKRRQRRRERLRHAPREFAQFRPDRPIRRTDPPSNLRRGAETKRPAIIIMTFHPLGREPIQYDLVINDGWHLGFTSPAAFSTPPTAPRTACRRPRRRSGSASPRSAPPARRTLPCPSPRMAIRGL